MSNTALLKYEEWLSADLARGFEGASRHFENKSRVHFALRRLVKHLDAFGITYAIAGDMAMFFHGYRRFTEILEILVTADDLSSLRRQRDSLGYVADSLTSMDLRDAELGVRIHFLATGTPNLSELPLPVRYPDPAQVAIDIDGLRVLSLPALVELKLAWGMKGPRHLRHLGDVQCLIDHLRLPQDFADRLDPLVRSKYWEMWMDVENDPCRGVLIAPVPRPSHATNNLRSIDTIHARRSSGSVEPNRILRPQSSTITDLV